MLRNGRVADRIPEDGQREAAVPRGHDAPEGNKVAFVMPKAVASTLADEIRVTLGAEASPTLVQS